MRISYLQQRFGCDGKMIMLWALDLQILLIIFSWNISLKGATRTLSLSSLSSLSNFSYFPYIFLVFSSFSTTQLYLMQIAILIFFVSSFHHNVVTLATYGFIDVFHMRLQRKIRLLGKTWKELHCRYLFRRIRSFDSLSEEAGLNGLMESECGESILPSSCLALSSSRIFSGASKNSASWLEEKSILDRGYKLFK